MRRDKVSKNKRRKEAEERTRQRASITNEQQIAKLNREGHLATKERARLSRQIKGKRTK